jgi:hypothetical protein
MPIRFVPQLGEAERVRVTVAGYSKKERLIDAMIKAEEQAESEGYAISWTHKLANEAHGIARRT